MVDDLRLIGLYLPLVSIGEDSILLSVFLDDELVYSSQLTTQQLAEQAESYFQLENILDLSGSVRVNFQSSSRFAMMRFPSEKSSTIIGFDEFSDTSLGISFLGSGDIPATDTASEILIYPNPARDNLFVEADPAIEIEMFDLNGQRLQLERTVDFKGRTLIDLTKVESGLYLIDTGSESLIRLIVDK